ncbi:hypothetical protein SY88_19830 [Clostridiales bacterium PH28_bin88]|nr:hypothetical protein SY88_19830 [Clostridiales bacterium PH28_bin88]
MAEVVVDLMGEVCPVPLWRSQKQFAELGPGDVLVVRTDYGRAVRNLLDWAERSGLEFEVEDVANGVWEVKVVKS